MRELLKLLKDDRIEQAKRWLNEHPDFFSKEPQESFPLLNYAFHAGHLSVIKMLIEHGADVNTVDVIEGTTLLQSAAQSSLSNTEQVSFLIDQGLDVHRTDCYDNTALIYAAHSGSSALIELLIRHGIDLNARGDFGLTAVMWATRQGRLDITQQLVAAGASIFIKTLQGESLLEAAQSKGQDQIANYLAPLFLAAQEKEALDAVTMKLKPEKMSDSPQEGAHHKEALIKDASGIMSQPLRL